MDRVAGPPSLVAKHSVASTAGSCVMNAGVPPYVRACVLARACMSYMRVVRAGVDAPGAGEGRGRSGTLKGALHGVRKA